MTKLRPSDCANAFRATDLVVNTNVGLTKVDAADPNSPLCGDLIGALLLYLAPAVALAYVNGKTHEDLDAVLAHVLGIDVDFVRGMTIGFDGDDPTPLFTDAMVIGAALGILSRQLVDRDSTIRKIEQISSV